MILLGQQCRSVLFCILQVTVPCLILQLRQDIPELLEHAKKEAVKLAKTPNSL